MEELSIKWTGTASNEQILKLNELINDPVFKDVPAELIGKRPNDRG